MRVVLLLLMFMTPPLWGGENITISVRDNFSLSKLYVEILTEAYRRIEVPVTFSYLPGGSSLKYSNSGQLGIDGEAGRLAMVQKKYTHLRSVNIPIFNSELTPFATNPDLKVENWSDMAGIETTTRLGYKYVVDKLKQEKINANFVESSETAITLVSNNRADVAILTKEDGVAAIKKLGINNVHILQPAITALPVYHMLNEKHEALIKRLEMALSAMQREGVLERMWSSHRQRMLDGLPDVEMKSPGQSKH